MKILIIQLSTLNLFFFLSLIKSLLFLVQAICNIAECKLALYSLPNVHKKTQIFCMQSFSFLFVRKNYCKNCNVFFFLQIMVCKADEKIQVCAVQFQFEPNPNLFNNKNNKFPLYVSTRVKDLYTYIEEHYQLRPDSFRLLLFTSRRMVSFPFCLQIICIY